MLLCSLDPYRSHVNGAHSTVKGIYYNLIILEELTGDNAGKHFAILKMLAAPALTTFYPGIQQNTVTCPSSFVITVNIAQEQSFNDTVGLDIIDFVFSHRDVYRGLWKVTHWENLRIFRSHQTSGKTKNVVFPEVLN